MNTLSLDPLIKRNLGLKSLAISVGLHAAILSYLHFNPMLLQSPFFSLFGVGSSQPKLLETVQEELEKNRVLDEVFGHMIVLSPHFQQPHDLVQIPKAVAIAPNPEEVHLSSVKIEQEISFSKRTVDPSNYTESEILAVETPLHTLFDAPEATLTVASQLQIDAENSIPELSLPITFIPDTTDLLGIHNTQVLSAHFEPEGALNLTTSLSIPTLKISIDPKAVAGKFTEEPLMMEGEEKVPLLIPKTPSLPVELNDPVTAFTFNPEQYTFPPFATTALWNDDFDIDLTFLPNPEGEGYIFSLSVKPNCDLSAKSLKQNLYFVIDRSSTVQKHRFAVFKRAVLKALASMQKTDTFNIVMIDKKTVQFSPESKTATLKNIQAAEEFLDKQESGGLFAFADMYSKIAKILPCIPENNEVHTAILLTDGKTSMKTDRKQKTLKKWIEKNNRKLSLYACAVGRDNDLVSLDMLCSLTGGKLLYSDTHASLPRKLAKLVLDIKAPIAKDLIITAVPEISTTQVNLFTSDSQLLSLYGHQPYVIIGETDELANFELVIQGRHQDEWITLKKRVSFEDGRKGNHTLEEQWSAKKASNCYSRFLQDAKNSYFKQAKEIFKKYHKEALDQ